MRASSKETMFLYIHIFTTSVLPFLKKNHLDVIATCFHPCMLLPFNEGLHEATLPHVFILVLYVGGS